LQVIREEKIVQRVKGILFKEPESQVVECQYCGNTYSKTLDKCPHCGAPKKAKAH
jgi:rubrerythrin